MGYLGFYILQTLVCTIYTIPLITRIIVWGGYLSIMPNAHSERPSRWSAQVYYKCVHIVCTARIFIIVSLWVNVFMENCFPSRLVKYLLKKIVYVIEIKKNAFDTNWREKKKLYTLQASLVQIFQIKCEGKKKIVNVGK